MEQDKRFSKVRQDKRFKPISKPGRKGPVQAEYQHLLKARREVGPRGVPVKQTEHVALDQDGQE
jgi:hypothetical protein